jgi:hypothetical protein
MVKKSIVLAVLCIAIMASTVSADMAGIVCSILIQIYNALRAIGPAMVLLMFLYGGVKYVYSADDPGGRKQGRDICVHSLIGGIIILIALSGLYSLFGFTAICTGFPTT